MKTTLVILALLAAYAVSDALDASVNVYQELHGATPKQRCLMAYKGTTNAQQCKYL